MMTACIIETSKNTIKSFFSVLWLYFMCPFCHDDCCTLIILTPWLSGSVGASHYAGRAKLHIKSPLIQKRSLIAATQGLLSPSPVREALGSYLDLHFISNTQPSSGPSCSRYNPSTTLGRLVEILRKKRFIFAWNSLQLSVRQETRKLKMN